MAGPSHGNGPPHFAGGAGSGFPGAQDEQGNMASDSDEDSVGSDLEQIAGPEQFARHYIEEQERLFSSHGFHSHGQAGQLPHYPLPVDGPEHARQNNQHDVLRNVLGANFVGPVQQVLAPGMGDQRRVVDLCTGTGRWVVQMAQQFPHARFRGIDVVPIQTQYPASNVQFMMLDVNTPLRWGSHSVDFVHARSVSMAVRDYPAMLREVARILRPGGMFLSGEWARTVEFHPNLNRGSARNVAQRAVHFLDVVSNVLLHTRHLPPVSDLVPGFLEQSGVFDRITPEVHYIPIGDWPRDPTVAQQGIAGLDIFIRYADAVRPLLVSYGMSQGEVDNLIAGYTADLHNIRGLVGVYKTVFARRKRM